MSNTKETIIGIDLGTGFSAVSVMENGQPVIIPNSEGKRTTPSIVAFCENGEIKVGDAAKRQAVVNAKNTIYEIKRFIGKTYDQCTDEINRVSYKVVRGENDVPCVDINGKLYTPQEISAMVLQKMKKTAEDYIGHEVKKAIITVPAYFNNDERRATKDAGQIAGLEVVRIINEPTAASLSYGLDKKLKDAKIMVADLGAGTTDFSVLEIGDGVFEVNSTYGDVHLGGSDFDECIMNWVRDEFQKDNGIDLTKDKMALQRIKDESEKAKIELSSSNETEINLPYITVKDGTPLHFVKKLNRATFDKMTSALINRAVACAKKSLEKASLSINDINDIILVGGTTRIPSIQKALKDIFGKEPNKSVNPDEAVSCGASVQASIINGTNNDILLLDVIPLSLGIETMGNVFTKLIDANTTVPTKKTQIFSTAQDNQPSVDINILQGERPMAKDNKSLGRFILDGIPPSRRGVPQIEVTIDVDANSILTVTAVDKGTGKKNNIRIEGGSQLSKEEIERMKAEAKANEESDKKEKEKIDKLNMADSMIFSTEKQMEDMKDKLTDDDKKRLQEPLDELKKAHQSQDITKIDEISKKLGDIWNDITSKLYQQTQQTQQSTNENTTTSDNTNDTDNAQDTPYEDVK